MINPYALSFINLSLSIILGTALIIYKYIYPKKQINLFFLLILISLLPVWSIFRPGVYESGDLWVHITQSISFYKSLTEGILIPRWAGQLNATFGFPAFMFIYSLPYYIISLFHFIGFSFVTATKLLIALSFITSGIGMFIWIKGELNEKAAFIASIFYLFVPYHLVDMHFRSDIGEMLAFAILPINLYLAKKFIEKSSVKFFALQAIFFAALIISHPAIAIAAPPLILAYMLFYWYRLKKRNIKQLINSFLSLAIGAMLSASFWLPTISLIKFTQQADITIVSFPRFLDFIFSPWRFGFLFQGHQGELSFILGYTQILILIYAVYLLFTNKFNSKHKPLIKLFLLLFAGYFFMMQSISAPLWHIIPFIRHFQFVYRLLLIVSIPTSVLAAITLYKLKNNYLLILILAFTVFSTILNWGNRNVIPQINDSTILKNLSLSTADGAGLGQAAPIWTNPNNTWENKIPKYHLEIISGQAEVKQISRSTNYHEYAVAVIKNTTFRENTLYFPGWNLYVNNKLNPIEVSKTNPKGTIEFKLKPGLYDLQLKFEDTFIIKQAKTITVTAFIFIIGILFFNKLRYNSIILIQKIRDTR